MEPHAITGEARARQLSFVERIHRMRLLGVFLCTLPIASVLAERDAPLPYWILLASNLLVWPFIARGYCRRAANPAHAQFNCMLGDTAANAAWMAVTAVPFATTAVFFTLLMADKIAAGGWRLAIKAFVVYVLAFSLIWLALGCPFDPEPSLRTRALTVPFLLIYTLSLSVLTRRLWNRIVNQNRELARLNRTDPVMQLANRQHFEETAAKALARLHGDGRPVSMLLIDVDRFKSVNDHFGHGMGDEVLKRIAGILRKHVVGHDLPARYGGDEFAALLVDVDAREAARLAEEIRMEVARQHFEAEPGLRCTLSIGVSEARVDFRNLDEWTRAADAALYRAKAAGRNGIAMG